MCQADRAEQRNQNQNNLIPSYEAHWHKRIRKQKTLKTTYYGILSKEESSNKTQLIYLLQPIRLHQFSTKSRTYQATTISTQNRSNSNTINTINN